MTFPFSLLPLKTLPSRMTWQHGREMGKFWGIAPSIDAWRTDAATPPASQWGSDRLNHLPKRTVTGYAMSVR